MNFLQLFIIVLHCTFDYSFLGTAWTGFALDRISLSSEKVVAKWFYDRTIFSNGYSAFTTVTSTVIYYYVFDLNCSVARSFNRSVLFNNSMHLRLRRNEERARGAQFPGRRITMGSPNDCGGHRNVPAMSKVLSSVQYVCFRKTPNLLLVPGAI